MTAVSFEQEKRTRRSIIRLGGYRNPPEEEIRRRHEATRKYCDGRLGRYRDDRDGRYTRYRDDNRDRRYERYRHAGGGSYPSDDDDTESDESRRSDHMGRSSGDRRRFRRQDSDPDGYSSPDGERDRHRRGKDHRSPPRRDPKQFPVIRPLNDLFTEAVDNRTIGWKVAARATKRPPRSELTDIGRSWRYR